MALARQVLAEVGPAYRPLGEARLIDGLAAQLPNREADHHYLWMETYSRPGTVSGEVEWLDADPALRVGPLFDHFFPGSYAKPGASAHRWAGVVAEPDGEPLAVAADAWSARAAADTWRASSPTPTPAAVACPVPSAASSWTPSSNAMAGPR